MPIEDFLPADYVEREEAWQQRAAEEAAAAPRTLPAGTDSEAFVARSMQDARDAFSRGDLAGGGLSAVRGLLERGSEATTVGGVPLMPGISLAQGGLAAITEGVPEGIESVGRAVALPLEGLGIEGVEQFRQQSREEADARARARADAGLATAVGTGVGRTATEMALLSGISGGVPVTPGLARLPAMAQRAVAIGTNAAPITLSESELTADQQGLEGADKAMYMFAQTAIETGMSIIGAGGAERFITRAGGRDAAVQTLKEIARTPARVIAREAGGEVVEENLTEFAQGFVDWWMLPDNAGKSYGDAFGEWMASIPEVSLVAGIMGGGGGVRAVRPQEQRADAQALLDSPALPQILDQEGFAQRAEEQAAAPEQPQAPAQPVEAPAAQPIFTTTNAAPSGANRVPGPAAGTAQSLSAEQVGAARDTVSATLEQRFPGRVSADETGVSVQLGTEDAPLDMRLDFFSSTEMRAAAATMSYADLVATNGGPLIYDENKEVTEEQWNATRGNISKRHSLLTKLGADPGGTISFRGADQAVPTRAFVSLTVDDAGGVDAAAFDEELSHALQTVFGTPEQIAALGRLLQLSGGRTDANIVEEGYRNYRDFIADRDRWEQRYMEAVEQTAPGQVEEARGIMGFLKRLWNSIRRAGNEAKRTQKYALSEDAKQVAAMFEGMQTGAIAQQPAQQVETTRDATSTARAQREVAAGKIEDAEKVAEERTLARAQRAERAEIEAEEATVRSQQKAEQEAENAKIEDQKTGLAEADKQLVDEITDIEDEIDDLTKQSRGLEGEDLDSIRGEIDELKFRVRELKRARRRIAANNKVLNAGKSLLNARYRATLAAADDALTQESQARALRELSPEEQANVRQRIADRPEQDEILGRAEQTDEVEEEAAPVVEEETAPEPVAEETVEETVEETEEDQAVADKQVAVDSANSVTREMRGKNWPKHLTRDMAEATKALEEAEAGTEQYLTAEEYALSLMDVYDRQVTFLEDPTAGDRIRALRQAGGIANDDSGETDALDQLPPEVLRFVSIPSSPSRGDTLNEIYVGDVPAFSENANESMEQLTNLLYEMDSLFGVSDNPKSFDRKTRESMFGPIGDEAAVAQRRGQAAAVTRANNKRQRMALNERLDIVETYDLTVDEQALVAELRAKIKKNDFSVQGQIVKLENTVIESDGGVPFNLRRGGNRLAVYNQATSPAEIESAIIDPAPSAYYPALQAKTDTGRAIQFAALAATNVGEQTSKAQTERGEQLYQKLVSGKKQMKWLDDMYERLLGGGQFSAADQYVVVRMIAEKDNQVAGSLGVNDFALSLVEPIFLRAAEVNKLMGRSWAFTGNFRKDMLAEPENRRALLMESMLTLNAATEADVQALNRKAVNAKRRGDREAELSFRREAEELRKSKLESQMARFQTMLQNRMDGMDLKDVKMDDDGVFFQLRQTVEDAKDEFRFTDEGTKRRGAQKAAKVAVELAPSMMAQNLLGLSSIASQISGGSVFAATRTGEAFIKNAAADVAGLLRGTYSGRTADMRIAAKAVATNIGGALAAASHAFTTGQSTALTKLGRLEQAREVDGRQDPLLKHFSRIDPKTGEIRASDTAWQVGLGIVYRTMAFVDEIFQFLTYAAGVSMNAARLGRERGYEGAALDSFIKRQMDPSQIDEQVADLTFNLVTDVTVKRPWGKQSFAGQAAQRLENFANSEFEVGDTKVRPLRLLFPFLRTPLRLAEQGLRRVPGTSAVFLANDLVNLWAAEKRGSMSAAEEAAMKADIAHQTASMIIWFGAALLAGSMLDDEELEELSEGRVGNFDFRKVEPISTSVRMTAKAIRALTSEDETLASFANENASTMADATIFGSGNRLFGGAFGDGPVEKMQSQFAHMIDPLGMVNRTSGMGRSVTQLMDPTYYQYGTRTPTVDALGRYAQRRETGLAAGVWEAFGVVNKPTREDDVIVNRLNATPGIGANAFRLDGVDSSSDLGQRYALAAGREFAQRLRDSDIDWSANEPLTESELRRVRRWRRNVSRRVRRQFADEISQAIAE